MLSFEKGKGILSFGCGGIAGGFQSKRGSPSKFALTALRRIHYYPQPQVLEVLEGMWGGGAVDSVVSTPRDDIHIEGQLKTCPGTQ